MSRRVPKNYADRYPRRADFDELAVTVRAMASDDAARITEFAGNLPTHDRLYLQKDITQTEVVEGWLDDLAAGRMAAVMALDGDRMIGYAMVIPSEEAWSRHVAEIRVAVLPETRGKGFGRFLTQEAFAMALACEVEKMVARMTPDQQGGIAAFEGLGFRPEGLLRDHIIDQNGDRHDLLMMGHDVQRFHSTMQAYGMGEGLS